MKKKSFLERCGMLQILYMFGFIPLVSCAMLLNGFSIFNIRHQIEKGVEEKLRSCATSVEQYFYDDFTNDNLEKNESVYRFIDSLQEDDIDLTLFIGDTRYVTSLRNEDGSRNEGTQASKAVYDAVKMGNDYFSKDVKINNTDYYVCYLPVYNADHEFIGMSFAGEPKTEVDKTVRMTVLVLIGVMLSIIVLFIFIISYASKAVIRPIAALTNSTKTLSEGNVNEPITAKARIKEYKILLEAALKLQENLKNIVSTIQGGTDKLVEDINNVTDLANTSNSSSSQILVAMDELANSTMQLAENVQNVSENIIKMGDDITGISVQVEDLNIQANTMREANNKAKSSMNTVLDSSNKSVKAIDDISRQINETNDSILKINEAISLILDITNQTKLLSLNASIEAARAGEAGRGFAVVAENIKKLSEQSESGANTIKTIANDILGKSEKSVKLAEQISQIIETEQQDIDSTQQSFNELNVAIEDSLKVASIISDKTTTLNNLKGEIISSVSELSAISEENAASNQEITANVNSIASGIEEISSRSNSINDLAGELKEAMKYFK